MSEKNTGGPAFPVLADVRPSIDKEWCGMTLRDYFAAEAMVTIWNHANAPRPNNVDQAAEWCYMMADSMLKAREL